MAVSILIPEELTRYSDGLKQVEVDGTTVGEALLNLFNDFPDLQKRLIDENRRFYPYIPAFLNDEKLALQGAWNRRLVENDQLAFMVMASGG